jgi:cwf18 pre-mRNA splicing factor
MRAAAPRRDAAPKLEKLNRRTQRAIVQMLREKMAKEAEEEGEGSGSGSGSGDSSSGGEEEE